MNRNSTMVIFNERGDEIESTYFHIDIRVIGHVHEFLHSCLRKVFGEKDGEGFKILSGYSKTELCRFKSCQCSKKS